MHSSHSRARRRQDSRSPVRDRDRSPVLLPRGHTHDADQGSRSSYSHAHSRSQPQPTSSRTSQSRRKTHQHDLPPPPYPASSAGLRDDRRDDHYGAAPVNVYSSHRHEDYYDRPEDSWPRSSHYQTEWNGRTEDYGYQESGWLPPQYVNGPHDHWVPSDARRDHRYEPREQPYAREERRQSWPVEESWPPPRGRDPINNWQPPSQSSWSPRKEPVDRGMRHDERVWQPAPNWQERRQSTRQENEQLPRSRYDGDDRRAHSYRADEKADTEARTPKNRAQKTHNGKTTKRQRSPSLTRSRSVSRSPRSRPTSPLHSRSPKRRRHEAEDIRDKSHRERPRKRSTSRESRTSVKADTRDRGRKRQRSLSPSSSRSRSPVAAPRALHRLPGPQPLRKLPPPTEPLSVKPTNNIADKAPTNGQANGTRRNKQRNNDQELRSGSNSIQPRPQTRRNPEDMDQDPPRDQAVHKDNGKARTGGKQSNNDKPQTPLVKKFFPGDEEESTPHRAGLGRQSLPARPDLPSRPQALQSPAGRELPRQVAGPSKEPARVAPSPLHALDRGLNDSARSSPRIPPPLYAPSPSLPPRPLGPSQNPTPTSRPTPTPRRTEEAHATTDSRSDELATLQTTADLFKVVAKVGEGTFGQVYKAGNGAGGFVALKRIRMESEREGFPVTAMREIKLLQSLSHVNIVKLHEMMISKGAVYMVCEYMNHDLTGVLCQKQFIFSPAHIKALCRQMFAGLAYLHHKGVIHRDLKGSNILLNNRGELKLADFGLARFYHKRRQADYTNRVITQWYRPPELLLGATVYGPEVDMWSAGCIMLELFTRRPIFQGDDEIHQLQVIYRVMGTPNTVEWPELVEQPWYELVKPKEVVPSQFRESFSRWLSPAALDVAQALLAYNPKRRMSAAQALAAPYFLSEDPRPEMPTGLSTLIGEWHELDSKKERAERAKQKRRVDEENVGDATGTRE